MPQLGKWRQEDQKFKVRSYLQRKKREREEGEEEKEERVIEIQGTIIAKLRRPQN